MTNQFKNIRRTLVNFWMLMYHGSYIFLFHTCHDNSHIDRYTLAPAIHTIGDLDLGHQYILMPLILCITVDKTGYFLPSITAIMLFCFQYQKTGEPNAWYLLLPLLIIVFSLFSRITRHFRVEFRPSRIFLLSST